MVKNKYSLPRHIGHGSLVVLIGVLIGVIGLYLTYKTDAITVTPRKTADFLNSMGVCMHPSSPAYDDTKGAIEKLKELNIKHVRMNPRENDDSGAKMVKAIAGSGAKLLFTIKAPPTGKKTPTTQQIRQSVDKRIDYIRENKLADATWGIESWNEYDNNKAANWAPPLKEQVKYLYQQKSRISPSVKILGPSMLGFMLPQHGPSMTRDSQGRLMNTYFDYGNLHSYYVGHEPESDFQAMLPGSQVSQFNKNPGKLKIANSFEERIKSYAYYISKNKPIIISETGYTNDPYNDYDGKIDEGSSGVYIPRAYLDTFRIGIQRTYMYELLDEPHTDPPRERFFGYYRKDGTPKPAAKAIKNMTTLLGGGDKSFTPTRMTYTASSKEPLKTFLMQKKPGEWWLAVWRPVSVYNTDTDKPTPKQASKATITFPSTKHVEYHRDLSMKKDDSVPSGAKKSFSLTVGAEVSLLKITN